MVFVANLLRGNGGVFAAGVTVGGLEVEGLTPEQAVERLEAVWLGYLANPVVVRLGDTTWRPTAADLGLAVDIRSALRRAYLDGQSGGIAQRIASRGDAAGGEFQPDVRFDPARLRAYLDEIAAGFDQPAVEADVELPADGRLRIRPSQPGRVIDVEGAIVALGDITRPTDGPRAITLQFREDRPRYRTGDAEALITTLRRMVSGPVTLMHGSGGWMIDPPQIRAALRIDRVDGQFIPGLEFTRFNGLFQDIDATLSAEPELSIFEYDEPRDRVTAFQPGHPGQRVDRTALEQAIAAKVVAEQDRRVEIPIILLNKEFDFTTNPLGVKDLLGRGSSIFHGSPDYRNHNIRAGTEKLDGQIIRPGEVFSFNERIGDFTLAEGWVEGSIIVEDKTERGIGGGICQVSTTLFRAVMRAGLAIEERWPHLYRVRYYEMGEFPIGIDATIFSPGPDLQFRNNYEQPIMLRALVDPHLSTLDFEIWGASDGRRVELTDHKLWNWLDPPPDQGLVDDEEPPDFEDQVEWSKKGVQASISRVIVSPDGTETKSTFRSSYTAWPNRFVVGIDVAKAKFPRAYNKWFDENPEKAATWGVGRIPGLPSDPDAPAG